MKIIRFTMALAISAMMTAGYVAVSSNIIPASAQAQATQHNDIIRALRPRTRGVTPVPSENHSHKELDRLIERLRAPAKNDASVVRQQIQKIIDDEELPSLDFEIYFDTNSAAIRPESIPTLTKLGLALRAPELASSTFLIAGHTDARGSNRYNLSLSQRRAAAVRKFLVDAISIGSDHLVAVGFGEEQLKRPDYPASGENRRVQITNLTY